MGACHSCSGAQTSPPTVTWLQPWWETWPLNYPQILPAAPSSSALPPGARAPGGGALTPFLSADTKETVQHIRNKEAVSEQIKILAINTSCQTCKVGPASCPARGQNDPVYLSPSGTAREAQASRME